MLSNRYFCLDAYLSNNLVAEREELLEVLIESGAWSSTSNSSH